MFSKNNPISFTHLLNFIKIYREKIAGTKFFPCIFVQNDLSPQNQFSISSQVVEKAQIRKITENYNFPFYKIKLNKCDDSSLRQIFNYLLDEIDKENKDLFPYNLIYRENLKLNYCLKFKQSLYWLSVCFFSLIIFLSIFDLRFTLKTEQDFSNLVMINL